MTGRSVALAIAATALAAIPHVSHAQSADQAGQGSATPLPPPDAGPLDRFGRLGAQQIQVTGGTKDKSASIALQIANWDITPHSVGGADAAQRINDTLNVIVSTPLGSNGEAQPANLDGLANGTKLTLRWGRWIAYTPLDIPPAARAIYQQAQAECRRAANSLHDGRVAALGTQPTPASVAAVAALHRTDLDECENPSGGSQNLVARHLPASERSYIRAFVPADARQFGLEASIGRNRFTFVDPATLASGAERRIQWSASAFYTQYLRDSKTAVLVSAGYERAYEAADTHIYCPPNPSNVVIRCTSAAGAPPHLNESLKFSLGLRHQVADRGVLRGIAVAPLFTYDALNDVVGVDVPVYFIPSSDGGLTGGVRFGYRSDRDNHFSVGVFIGAAFNILGGG